MREKLGSEVSSRPDALGNATSSKKHLRGQFLAVLEGYSAVCALETCCRIGEYPLGN